MTVLSSPLHRNLRQRRRRRTCDHVGQASVDLATLDRGREIPAVRSGAAGDAKDIALDPTRHQRGEAPVDVGLCANPTVGDVDVAGGVDIAGEALDLGRSLGRPATGDHAVGDRRIRAPAARRESLVGAAAPLRPVSAVARSHNLGRRSRRRLLSR